MRLKIVSDGFPTGTKVVNADTGELVEGVVAVTWSCSMDCFAEAVLTFELVECDVVGDLVATVESVP